MFNPSTLAENAMAAPTPPATGPTETLRVGSFLVAALFVAAALTGQARSAMAANCGGEATAGAGLGASG